ncbi:MAG: serine/threonine protein kinase with repeat [Actinomycetia bacterium]|nr:serine/threonine protein kinase with repeat [Actinomycetes bacterium]
MEPGALLGGKYQLGTRLGRGGMGEVWSATDRGLGRTVAIKIVLADLHGHAALIARLRNEARTAAALQHPGITVVHDIGEHDGHPFFVMELLDGVDFNAMLTASPAGLPVERVVPLMAQVADALAYAHRNGVVHRDIKPANLMELTEGGVKICDFGISRYADATVSLTTPGSVLGTPAYMAPEQYEGSAVNAQSDLYSLGCTLHALLTGAPPFAGPSLPALMRQHLTAPPPNLTGLRPDVPAELEHLVLQLLNKDPGDRPASGTQVSEVLRMLPTGPPRSRATSPDQSVLRTPPPAVPSAASGGVERPLDRVGAGKAEPRPSRPRPRLPEIRTKAAAGPTGSAPRQSRPGNEKAAKPSGSAAPETFSGGVAFIVGLVGLALAGLLSWTAHHNFVDQAFPEIGRFGDHLNLWLTILFVVLDSAATFLVLVFLFYMSPGQARSRRSKLFRSAFVILVAYPALEIMLRSLPWYVSLFLIPLYTLFYLFILGMCLTYAEKEKGKDNQG